MVYLYRILFMFTVSLSLTVCVFGLIPDNIIYPNKTYWSFSRIMLLFDITESCVSKEDKASSDI